MTIEERLRFCEICEKRKINRNIGMICSLTNQKPEFENNCSDFKEDFKESRRKLQLELNAAGDIRTSLDSSPKYLINLGTVSLISGTLFFILFFTLWGIVLIIVGILLIIKGKKQKTILAKKIKTK